MLESDVVKEARDAIKYKKTKSVEVSTDLPYLECEYDEDEQIEDDLTYDISIRVKIKKNGKHIPAKKDVLNWCGNILSFTKSGTSIP